MRLIGGCSIKAYARSFLRSLTGFARRGRSHESAASETGRLSHRELSETGRRPSETNMPRQSAVLAPRPIDLFVVWTTAAIQATGGGRTGQLNAYNLIVGSRRWISAEAWAECWGICQIAPGVNIMAMALLTGSRLSGLPGAGASLVGLLAPSIVATIILTRLYSGIEGTRLVQSGLHGLIAAALATSLLMSWRLANPIIRASRSRGAGVVSVALLVMVSCAVLIRTTQVPAFLLLLGGGIAMGITQWLDGRRPRSIDR